VLCVASRAVGSLVASCLLPFRPCSEIRQMREDAELEVANTKVLDQGTALAQLKAMVAKIGAKLADGPGMSSSLPH
jgi:hypothetical protein